MAKTFLGRFMNAGSTAMGQGVWDRAIAAGYSPKQIAVASHKEQAAGGKVGAAFKTNRKAAAAATKGSSNNWIHNYAGGSGAVGIAGLEAGLAAGNSLDQMTSAASGLHIKDDWGVAGFGRDASAFILNKRKDEEEARLMEERELKNQQLINNLNQSIQDSQKQYMDLLSNPPKTIASNSTGYKTNPASAGLTIQQSPTANSGGVNKLKRKKEKPSNQLSVLPGNQMNTGTQ